MDDSIQPLDEEELTPSQRAIIEEIEADVFRKNGLAYMKDENGEIYLGKCDNSTLIGEEQL